MKVKHVGCCGYPTSKQKYFEHFRLIELQITFYSLPGPETAFKWKDEAPDDFIFTMKAWQGITHPGHMPTYRRSRMKEFDRQKLGLFRNNDQVFKAWQLTRQIAEIIEAKIIVFQCPPIFKQSDESIENLRHFFTNIDRGTFILALELRSNWEPSLVKDLCSELNLVHCVDPFKENSVTGGLYYFRLHGKPPGQKMYRYQYTDRDLQWLNDYSEKLKDANEIYYLFNNQTSFEDALRFKQLLAENR